MNLTGQNVIIVMLFADRLS